MNEVWGLAAHHLREAADWLDEVLAPLQLDRDQDIAMGDRGRRDGFGQRRPVRILERRISELGEIDRHRSTLPFRPLVAGPATVRASQ